ncbi:hypothetical protein D3C72_861090 [compost metagenome]
MLLAQPGHGIAPVFQPWNQVWSTVGGIQGVLADVIDIGLGRLVYLLESLGLIVLLRELGQVIHGAHSGVPLGQGARVIESAV